MNKQKVTWFLIGWVVGSFFGLDNVIGAVGANAKVGAGR